MESPSAANTIIKKQEDDDKNEKRDIKPVPKTLNRVPRACNACRKQKMRCEGADNPPCKRCRNTGLECLFEKPSREATLTGEAGLERIRSLEAHVADIRQTQTTISNTLSELLHHFRSGGVVARSPSTYPPSSFQQSPSLNSPSMSTPTASHQHASPASGSSTYTSSHGSVIGAPQNRASRASVPNSSYHNPALSHPSQVMPSEELHPPQLSPIYGNFAPGGQGFAIHAQTSQGPVLPPFSSIQTMGPPVSQQSNVSSVRYQSSDPSLRKYPASGSKRHAPPSSNVTSADSSDFDDDDNGELPAQGLVAPWEVLRGLADVAIERAAKETGDSSEPHSRTRTPSPERNSRPSKRRKIRHKLPQGLTFPDVVTKGIITEADARELFKIFYHGCSTFLPVFDSNIDTYDALHERSPFAVDCICMVAARVRDRGGKPSEIHLRCLEEVQAISSATLFVPVMRSEAVQSMILVSGWSDNGWLSGGHAVRMAMELSMHKAWPKLLRRMNANKMDHTEDRHLVIASRTWFCLYLFEHQLSYGTGRPAVLKDDESIRDCRYLLNHPLAIEDDMRLVSTVELIAIRERVHNALAPFESPVKPEHLEELHRADTDFRNWYAAWDEAFSRKYEDAAFYRQSLQIQHLHAELFHNATALRGLNGPEDVHKMPPAQRELAIRSIQIARQGLDITVNSPAYREGMKYAVHYTHATATFAASFLLRLARLFPNDCDIIEIRHQVERLAILMAEIPGKRYALTLQLMLKRSKRRKGHSTSRSPKVSRDPQRSSVMVVDHPSASLPTPISATQGPVPFPQVYDTDFSPQDSQGHPHLALNSMPQHHPHLPHPNFAEAEQIWRSMEHEEQVPVWISDQSLGGNSFSQHGMDAFIIPTEYLPVAPQQIW
ncbi:hypothetical protein B0H34DRAFT_682848 [Crassisporium funariophilum]|nr:hypothetical protein B0H34DRAFT_682848 [Crassisporium funariophilum]